MGRAYKQNPGLKNRSSGKIANSYWSIAGDEVVGGAPSAEYRITPEASTIKPRSPVLPTVSGVAMQAQVKELTKQRDEAIAKEQQAQRELAILTAKAQAEDKEISEPNDGLVAITETPKKEETPKVEGVKPPTVHSFSSVRTKVDKGQSATLGWHVSNASEILVEPGVGSVSALGSINVKPTKTTTYKLTAKNEGGETVETWTVEVR